MRIIVQQTNPSYYEDGRLMTPILIYVTSSHNQRLTGLVSYLRHIAYCAYSFTSNSWLLLDGTKKVFEQHSDINSAEAQHILCELQKRLLDIYEKIVLKYFVVDCQKIFKEYCINEIGDAPPPISDEDISRYSSIDGG